MALPRLFDDRRVGELPSGEGAVIFDRNSALLHEARDKFDRLVVTDSRRHSDRHSFCPVQRCHPERSHAVSVSVRSEAFDVFHLFHNVNSPVLSPMLSCSMPYICSTFSSRLAVVPVRWMCCPPRCRPMAPPISMFGTPL